MKSKIAILVHNLGGGGMERVAAQLSTILYKSNYDVYIITTERLTNKCYQYHGKVITVQSLNIKTEKNEFFKLLHCIDISKKVKEVKKNISIDLTISFGQEMNFISFLSNAGDKKIFTIHSCLSERRDLNRFMNSRILMHIYNYIEKVVTVSKWCKNDLESVYGIKKQKIQVIYNPSYPQITDRKTSVENNILVVGRLQDVKRQWHIIRAFSEVIKVIPNVKLIIAGDGENYAYLKLLVRQYKIEKNIIFLGFVQKIEEQYNKAKILIFSSESEAFPCAVVESLSFGVPVIAADCPGGIREILQFNLDKRKKIKKPYITSCGIITPKFDGKKYMAIDTLTYAEAQMAKSIIFLLRNEKLRKNMEEQCFKRSNDFNINIISNEWRKLIQEII